MLKTRSDGAVQPGFKWGPFTMRIPFIHLRFSLSNMLQGLAVAGASGLAGTLFYGAAGAEFRGISGDGHVPQYVNFLFMDVFR